MKGARMNWLGLIWRGEGTSCPVAMSIAVYTVPEALKEPQRASNLSHIIRKQNTYDDVDVDSTMDLNVMFSKHHVCAE